jgi:tRNA U38,U39,U40 pseudouridine synthase TruA
VGAGALDRFLGEWGHQGAVISSRTDAGVHALRNVFHVDVYFDTLEQRASGDTSAKRVSPAAPTAFTRV